MGIWVRSQDKRILMPVNNHAIQIFKYDNNSFLEEEKPEKISFGIVADDRMMGEYSTEAEALKVLDMIQERLANVCFQMPEAGFSEKGKFKTSCGNDLYRCGYMEDGSITAKCGGFKDCKLEWNKRRGEEIKEKGAK